MTDTLKNAGLF